MKNKNFVQLTVGGPAGFGIMRAGWLLAKSMSLGGLYAVAINEYPSRIEGGHNFVMVRASPKPIHSHWPKSDVVLAFDRLSIERHKEKIVDGGAMLYDSSLVKETPELPNVELIPIPFTDLALKNKLRPITRNTIALGSMFAAIGFELDILYKAIEKAFKGKEKVIEMNKTASKIGHDYYRENYKYKIELPFKPNPDAEPKYFLSGNEATNVGALAGGLTWYSAYPMTPASPILHYFAAKQFQYDMVNIQAESELAAVLMAIGASYAGARAMTGTSGGGFSLMTESLGMAAMGETPLVIVVVQRPGPSTGLPTHTAQGDLRFVLHASQGEFPRFVVAPGDVREMIYYMQVILNLVEKYQVPGIVLSDKHLGESYWTFDSTDGLDVGIERGKIVDKANWDYKRYLITEDGVSPMAYPGTPGAVNRSNSHEHDELGIATDDPKKVVEIFDKRWRKYKFMREEIKKFEPVKVYGDRDADVAIIFWGSTKGAVLDAYEMLRADGYKARLVQVVFLEPFPDEEFLEAIKGAKTLIDVETNYLAQLAGLIKEKVCVDIHHKITKYNGRPFSDYELYEKIKEVL